MLLSWKVLLMKAKTQFGIQGVANGKCETLRDRETSVFLCEPETSKCFECERETCRLSENLSTVNKLYYFPGHDLISCQEVALSG